MPCAGRKKKQIKINVSCLEREGYCVFVAVTVTVTVIVTVVMMRINLLNGNRMANASIPFLEIQLSLVFARTNTNAQ